MDSDIDVVHDEKNKQFTANVEGKICYLKYSLDQEAHTLDYFHTFVPTELRGRNIGQEIVEFALAYAITNHFKVIPSCPFVQKYLDQHIEYKNIVAQY